ncbi:MAG: hypothetical protein RBG13Loki_1848 [Promethearchaeota archaeon CR_4]|nr:MAG: hypothetical protein RBG13Loki_1848 [Candidatus Lokiarchaeota archaeon CR_4]
MHFLVECKAIKIGINHVDEFKDKLDAIKRGGDPRSIGVPIMATSEAWSKQANDEAQVCGIQLMTFEQMQGSFIPIPRDIYLQIGILDFGNNALIQRNEVISLPVWGKVSIVKSKIDYTIRGLGMFDIYMELEKEVKKEREYTYVFGKYIGMIDENTMRLWVQNIDGYIERERAKGNKVYGAIGFYTRSVSDEDKKLITKLKNSTKSDFAVIDENFNIYGNQDAKKIFSSNERMRYE